MKYFAAIIFLACTAYAETGPIFQHKDPEIQREFQELYRAANRNFFPGGIEASPGDTITSGNIGHVTSSITVSRVYGSSGTIIDFAAIDVDAGNYLVSGCHVLTNGTDTAVTGNSIFIATTTGNTSAGTALAKDMLNWDVSYTAGGFRSNSWCFSPIYYSFTESKTYYFKARAAYSNTAPQGTTYIQAMRQP
jgi:hypothetical protein